MKMQSARAEYVRFTSADVIATSGPYFYMSPAGLTDFNRLNRGAIITTDGNVISAIDATEPDLMGFGFWNEGTYYHLVNYAGSVEGEGCASLMVEKLAAKPLSGTELKSYQEIAEWVSLYGASVT